MSGRPLALLLSVVVAALAGTGCADSVSPAVVVDGTSIGNDELIDEVETWASNPQAINPESLADAAPGTYPLELVRQILQQRVEFTLHRQEFERLGLELDDDHRQRALAFVLGDPSAAEEAFAAWDEQFADSFIDDVARQIALSDELGPEGYDEWRSGANEDAGIEVNPRYGEWNAETGQIDAPSGPVQPPTAFGS